MKVCLYLELESLLSIGGIGAAVANQRKALELNGVPYTCDLKDDFDVIHINVIGPRSMYVAKKMKRRGKKVILHAHVTAEDFRDSYRFSNEVSPYLRRYLRRYYRLADLVLCPSEYTRGVLESYGLDNEIIPITNGVDTDRFAYCGERRTAFRNEHGLDSTVPFNVGHLFMRKGLDTFVSAAKGMENPFIWIGKRYRSLEDPRVTRLINDAPGNITFLNYVKDIISVYSGGDIFFFPSHCENQGIAILEACACARPVLVRDIPTYEDWLEDGRNCLKAGTEEEFSEKLQALTEDPALCRKLSENALALSREHSLRNVGARLGEIYEDIA